MVPVATRAQQRGSFQIRHYTSPQDCHQVNGPGAAKYVSRSIKSVHVKRSLVLRLAHLICREKLTRHDQIARGTHNPFDGTAGSIWASKLHRASFVGRACCTLAAAMDRCGTRRARYY